MPPHHLFYQERCHCTQLHGSLGTHSLTLIGQILVVLNATGGSLLVAAVKQGLGALFYLHGPAFWLLLCTLCVQKLVLNLQKTVLKLTYHISVFLPQEKLQILLFQVSNFQFKSCSTLLLHESFGVDGSLLFEPQFHFRHLQCNILSF